MLGLGLSLGSSRHCHDADSLVCSCSSGLGFSIQVPPVALVCRKARAGPGSPFPREGISGGLQWVEEALWRIPSWGQDRQLMQAPIPRSGPQPSPGTCSDTVCLVLSAGTLAQSPFSGIARWALPMCHEGSQLSLLIL